MLLASSRRTPWVHSCCLPPELWACVLRHTHRDWFADLAPCAELEGLQAAQDNLAQHWHCFSLLRHESEEMEVGRRLSILICIKISRVLIISPSVRRSSPTMPCARSASRSRR